MSLKSKLEAVIYAAEEPVTLTQLATLFGNEALEFKTAQEAAATQQAATDAAANGVDLSQPVTTSPEHDRASEPSQSSDQHTAPESGTKADSIENAAEIPLASPATEASPVDATPLDPEAEAKRISRQRDRDVKVILRQLIDELIAEYANDQRGIEIREIAGGYRMATK